MPGVLSFTLGLEASAFINSAGEAGKAMLALLGPAELLGKAFDRVKDSLKQGAGLYDLSFRLNTSVASLYQLQHAFTSVHMSGEEAAPMLLRLQRALSGVSDTGERTENAFAMLGLRIMDLRKMDPASQFMAVAGALGKVNSGMATGLASNLFGRFSYGEILQVARQFNQFKTGFAGGAEGGAVFAQAAKPFRDAEVLADEIKQKFDLMWAQATIGFIEPTKKIFKTIGDINWVGIGQAIGSGTADFIELIKAGKLGEVLGETFLFALKEMADYAAPMFQNFGVLLLDAFKPAVIFLHQSMIRAVSLAFNNPLISSAIAPLLLASGHPKAALDMASGKTFNGMVESMQKSAGETDGKILDGLRNYINEQSGLVMATANVNGKADLAEFKKTIAGLMGNRKPDLPAPDGGGGGGGHDGNPLLLGALKFPATAWEKMGFVMNTGVSSAQDHARQVAQNTAKANQLLASMKNLLEHSVVPGMSHDLKNQP